MAIGTKTDFQIYDEQFWGGMTEVLEQDTAVFNEASRGALRLVPEIKIGEYEKESFITSIAGVVSRRDTTSTSAAVAVKAAMGEIVRVKLDRKIGPIDQTLDSLRKVGMSNEEFSFLMGQQYGKAVLVDQVNSVIRALVGSITGNAGVVNDVTAAGSNTDLNYVNLNGALRLFGDQASRIVAWLMHSGSAFDLIDENISLQLDTVAGVTIINGNIPGALGKPIIVTDCSALFTSGARDVYTVFGLTEGAADVVESESRTLVAEVVTGLENLVMRIQGEYAYNVGVKGYKYQTGGVNPNDAALVNTANWAKVATDNKSTAGVALKHHLRSDAIAS